MLFLDWLRSVRRMSRHRLHRSPHRQPGDRRRFRRGWSQASGVERLEKRLLLIAPITMADSYSVDDDTLDTSADGESSVLANDMDYDGPQALTASLDAGPSHGSLTLGSDGHFVY